MPKKDSVATDPKTIARFLDVKRDVENVYPSREAVEEALKSGRRLTVYAGYDPTGPSLHIGNAITLRKLAQLQKMGHRVIMLIGDFTAMIGDPTDKAATRKQLMREEVLANCKNYKKQASRFLDFSGPNAAEMKFNSEWLAEMSFADVVELAAHFTVQQMAERSMFEERIKDGKPVYLHEFLYPLMQGYDSVAMDVDMEIGGNDQTFNMLAGRTLMREMRGQEKFVVTSKLLVDPTGKKMGKTEGNMITLDDAPEDMYGKVMSWTDGMIIPGFQLCTDVSDAEIAEMSAALEDGENPVAFKHRLAREIAAAFLGEEAAERAAEHFSRVHQSREAPEEMPELAVDGEVSLVEALVKAGLVPSKTEARRQIQQGGVKVNGEVIKDIEAVVEAGAVIQKGKRHFVRLV